MRQATKAQVFCLGNGKMWLLLNMVVMGLCFSKQLLLLK